jgi:alkanesulfonate monooxygenase SsuD/methylene tetrahydromethanopterin reductase-like flavin-dependent oxidoreductase (luciferase family)
VKFGILQFFSWPDRRVDLPTVYRRALDRIEIMDSAGYDAVWLTEHHFSGYSVCPSIPVLGAFAAARTKRIRIGAGVTLAGFYHPLRLAEEIALLDVLSGGRVNWGAGRGFDLREFNAFGVKPEESFARFREVVDIVLAAWREPRLTLRTEHYSFDNLEVLPRPVQKPHPPVWLAASSPDAIRSAAADGFSILMSPHSSHGEIGEQLQMYRAALREHGHREDGREIPIARLVAVAPTDAEAREVAAAGAAWMIQNYARGASPGSDEERIERYVNSVVIHGSPARVRDEIARLRAEIGLEYLIGAPLSHQSFLSFTNDVIPHFG